MKLKIVEIDFEYCNPSEPNPEIICCSLRFDGKIESYWRDELEGLKYRIHTLISEYTFVAHNVLAEARCFIALGINPLEVKWICTFAEWRGITNHYASFKYGPHLVKGVKRNLIPPYWGKFGSEDSHQKLTHSLSEMVYKLKGAQIDTKHKNEMRDILISADLKLIDEHREAIIAYCESDIIYLYQCVNIIFKEILGLTGASRSEVLGWMWERGKVMASTAKIESLGYPIDVEATKNFSNQTHKIIKDCQIDINRQFPEKCVFIYNKSTNSYVRKEKPIREWIDSLPYADDWERTETDQYSLSLDAFAKFFNYRHEFPQGNFGAQMLRYLKLNQSLNGFKPVKKKGARSFWDSVGSDGRVRANINPYGSQSGRFQPSATGFIPLKAAWMRSLIQPSPGKAIIGIDYKSQEYLIAALMSGDELMRDAYISGDVYMAYAVASGIAPEGATKKSHPKERDLAKPVVLGISYDMSKIGLSRQLSEATKEDVSETEAQEYIDLFYETYSTYAEWKEMMTHQYEDLGYVRIKDGWAMWGDNHNHRSVGNCPVQGTGAAILRKAILLCQEQGLDVIFPLHDALYVEVLIKDLEVSANRFKDLMIQAFDHYLPNSGVMVDGEIWSPELEGVKVPGFKVETIHIDERSVKDYELFSKYFTTPLGAFL